MIFLALIVALIVFQAFIRNDLNSTAVVLLHRRDGNHYFTANCPAEAVRTAPGS
jgi:hypothetical protein